jgi:hypothetical protein
VIDLSETPGNFRESAGAAREKDGLPAEPKHREIYENRKGDEALSARKILQASSSRSSAMEQPHSS